MSCSLPAGKAAAVSLPDKYPPLGRPHSDSFPAIDFVALCAQGPKEREMSVIVKWAGGAALLAVLLGSSYSYVQAKANKTIPAAPSAITLQALTQEEKATVFNALAAKAELRNKLQQKLNALWELSRQEAPEETQIAAQLQECLATKAECEAQIRGIDAELAKAIAPCSRARLFCLGVLENGVTRDAWTILQEPADDPPAKVKSAKRTARWFLPKGPGLD
jgi:hypothetical protein